MGLEVDEAVSLIESRGLTVTSVRWPNGGQPRPGDVVTCQSPRGGTIVDDNARVHLEFSSGPSLAHPSNAAPASAS